MPPISEDLIGLVRARLIARSRPTLYYGVGRIEDPKVRQAKMEELREEIKARHAREQQMEAVQIAPRDEAIALIRINPLEWENLYDRIRRELNLTSQKVTKPYRPTREEWDSLMATLATVPLAQVKRLFIELVLMPTWKGRYPLNEFEGFLRRVGAPLLELTKCERDGYYYYKIARHLETLELATLLELYYLVFIEMVRLFRANRPGPSLLLDNPFLFWHIDR